LRFSNKTTAMNRYLRHLTIILALSTIATTAMADIVENFNREGSTIIVEQPQALAERLRNLGTTSGDGADDETSEEREVPVQMSKGKVVGYRVQVYADNNQRVAKGEARQRERAIGSRFPSMATYMGYVAPYWRLRVGDFRTQAEAQKAATDIRKAFPAYAKEIRVVRDRINAR
jgi:mRNA-degrading endonuclease RelE of RelBE toxin-antitoxin system